MSERSPRFRSWWTPGLGVTVWHYYVRVHSNITSSRVWVHGTVIHHSYCRSQPQTHMMRTHMSSILRSKHSKSVCEFRGTTKIHRSNKTKAER